VKYTSIKIAEAAAVAAALAKYGVASTFDVLACQCDNSRTCTDEPRSPNSMLSVCLDIPPHYGGDIVFEEVVEFKLNKHDVSVEAVHLAKSNPLTSISGMNTSEALLRTRVSGALFLTAEDAVIFDSVLKVTGTVLVNSAGKRRELMFSTDDKSLLSHDRARKLMSGQGSFMMDVSLADPNEIEDSPASERRVGSRSAIFIGFLVGVFCLM